jgi:hypothetical protein
MLQYKRPLISAFPRQLSDSKSAGICFGAGMKAKDAKYWFVLPGRVRVENPDYKEKEVEKEVIRKARKAISKIYQPCVRVARFCDNCKKIKPFSEFPKQPNKDELKDFCKDCRLDFRTKKHIRETTKLCPSCRQWKVFGEFRKEARSKDGLGGTCKACLGKRDKIRYEKVKPRQAALMRDWYSKNKDAAIKRMKRWFKNNPGKRMTYSHTRRARKIGDGGKITPTEWNELKERYNYTCLCCKRREPEIRLSLDHVKPLVIGGSNTIGNAQPLCRPCNSRKGRKEIDYRVSYAP